VTLTPVRAAPRAARSGRASALGAKCYEGNAKEKVATATGAPPERHQRPSARSALKKVEARMGGGCSKEAI